MKLKEIFDQSDTIIEPWRDFEANCFRVGGPCRSAFKEYSQNTVFPTTMTLGGDPGIYTFAIFGKSGSDIDKRPTAEGEVITVPGTNTLTSPTMTASDMYHHYVWYNAWIMAM